MSGPLTATIEVLTAEVRVLMVGSRQVTLSVARQLDFVDLDDMEVFGRVTLGKDEPTPPALGTVIGREHGTGALVLARLLRAADLPFYWHGTPLRLCLSLSHDQQQGGDHLDYQVRWPDRLATLELARADVAWCQVHPGWNANPPPPCDPLVWPETSYARLMAEWDEADERIRRHLAAQRMPLIVLAGLR